MKNRIKIRFYALLEVLLTILIIRVFTNDWYDMVLILVALCFLELRHIDKIGGF
jgi:hypothetical protein